MYHFEAGKTPLLISMPHAGTLIPDDIAQRMTTAAHRLEDTDWHVDKLYDFAGQLEASLLWAKYSRYVIDLNRAPDGVPLYPGSSNTELCPLTSFSNEALYLPGEEPDRQETEARRNHFWQPYHQQLAHEISRLLHLHGTVLLYEAHSIRSRVPRFFPGKLPDLNLGTGGGTPASPDLTRKLHEVCQRQDHYTVALNGRFKGGYITRHYGHPEQRIHAIQLELTQCTYMSEVMPFEYDDDAAGQIRPLLKALLNTMLEWSKQAREGQRAATDRPGSISPGRK